MLLHLTCAFEVITLSNERVIALFHHFFLQFRHIVEIDQTAHNTTTSRTPVPCILQILTTFNFYSGRPRVGLSVNNKQKVRQAMVKISRGGDGNHTPPPLPLARYGSRNGLTIGGLSSSRCYAVKLNSNFGLSLSIQTSLTDNLNRGAFKHICLKLLFLCTC